MFNRLYIIGNGFDIAHGYNTQFQNFLEWMQIFYPNDYWTFSTYFDEYLLWNDFEYSLDTFDFDQFSNDHYPIEDTPKGKPSLLEILIILSRFLVRFQIFCQNGCQT